MFEHCTLIDLTHSIHSKIPTWDGAEGFRTEGVDGLYLRTNSGTHIDAPSYFAPKSDSIDKIPLRRLFCPALVMDLSREVSPDTVISSEEILAWEEKHGVVKPDTLFVAHTGWSRNWPRPKDYLNNGQFPTFGLEAIQLLLARNVAGIAIDTLALESLASSFPGHKRLFEHNRYIIENIANADKLPPKGAFVLALPLKIEKGEEAPARVVGLIP